MITSSSSDAPENTFPGLGLTVRSTNTSHKSDVDAVLEMAQLVKIFLIALTTQALVTGTYFASFLLCLRWFVFSDDGGTIRKGIKWHLLIITIILFAFSLGEFGIFLHLTVLISNGCSIGELYMTFIGVCDSIN
jgi:hypothetical protein